MKTIGFGTLARTAALVTMLAGCGDDGSAADDDTGSTSMSSMSTDGMPPGDTTLGPDDTTSTSGMMTTGVVDDTGTESGSTGEPPDPPNPPDIPGRTVVCQNDIAPAPAGEVCGVTAGSSTILLQGKVLQGFDIYENGTVLIDGSQPNGQILCTGCDCGDDPAAAGATVVACADGVISPGLINAHDHLTFDLSQPVPHDPERYDHRHEWRLGLNGATELDNFPGSSSSREAVLVAELRMLFGGATAISGSAGSSSAQGLLRNLERADLTEGLQAVDVNPSVFPLGDSGGQMLTVGCGYPQIDGTGELAADQYMPHVSEGINAAARNEFQCLSGAPGGEDLRADNTAIIHGVGVLADDIATMAERGTMLVTSARSNIDLYGVTADIPTYRNLGVRMAMSTDWTASGSMNMLRKLQCVDSFKADHLDGTLTDLEIWLMATYWAATSTGAGDQIGLIREGYLADLTIFDGSVVTDHRAVIEARPEDIALVMRGGHALHGDAALVEGLTAPADLALCETLDMCGDTKRTCAELDTTLSINDITSAVNPAYYDLFFCGTPDLEPSCDPARPDRFPDRGGPADNDGDGVADDDDNCPTICNPIRPMDMGMQADADRDGQGDPCDLCPLDSAQACTIPSLFDVDGDGVFDPDDNCLHVANPAQTDGDADGLGDDCDACPAIPNPGGSACPSTIYDVKDGTVAIGESVLIEDVTVTGVGFNGYFVQVHPDDPGYMGVDFSGLFVFQSGFGVPAVGDRVDITGTVSDYFGQIQLVAGSDPVVLSSGNPPPPPEITTVVDIVEGGPLQEELEGVVVTVFDLDVTDIAPVPGPGDGVPTNEFEVMGGLRVDDFFYLVEPFPTVGQNYPQITGVSRWANQYTKLEPRDATDFPPVLIAFGDMTTYLELGAMAEPYPGLAPTLNGPALMDTTINLTYGNAAIVTGPPTIDILTGTTSSPLQLTGVSAGSADVTAELDGVMFTTSVTVYDAAAPRIPTLSPMSTSVGLNDTVDLTVTLNVPAPAGGQLVGLATAPAICASVPVDTVVPAGELSVDFTVTAGACVGTEIVTASIGAATSDSTVNVIDAPVFPNLVLAEVYYDGPGADDLFEWVKIYNGTGATVDLSGYSIAWGGTDFTYGALDLVGSVANGECFVVGGPSGDASNGWPAGPMYGQSIDFNPDLQNSGATADGVAIFGIPAASITPASVPVDVVLYGTANASMLPDETGMPAAVDIGDVSSGNSIRLQADGTWASEPNPAPTVCLPLP